MTRSLQRAVRLALALAVIAPMGALHAAGPAPFSVPADATMPGGPEGDAIKLGREIVNDTRKRLPHNVGGGLTCTNCHIGAGTKPNAGPFVGLWGVFPEYRSRSNRIDSMQQRINECFERSMNGKALPVDSREMNALLMYIQWLSTGVPTGEDVAGRGMGSVNTTLKPNAANGKTVYAQKCALCHGAEGAGTKNGAGGYAFPPLWGKASFNVGAGMARTYTAATFIKHNMPVGQEGSLSDQEAIDVAQYITHQPRPAYAPAKNDYANGGKPKDARY